MSRRKINSKKSFTLIEIIIVVIILSITTYLSISNSNFSNKNINKDTSLVNLKQKLVEYDFTNNITLRCINDGKKCLVFIDGTISENEILDLFTDKPIVYSYDDKFDIISYPILELEKLESFEVCFTYTINKYYKSDDMIVEVDEKFYLFNSVHNKAKLFENKSLLEDYLSDKLNEVKDAF